MSKKELNVCSKNVPKPIRYMIANMLSYSDLKNLSLTNKECLELWSDDNYWKSRIRRKLGTVPESAKDGDFKKWYINNVNDVYYLVTDTDVPKLWMENIKSMAIEHNCYSDGDGYFYIDSFGNLNYHGFFDICIEKNVKTIVGDRLLPSPMDVYCERGIYYIDENEDLCVKNYKYYEELCVKNYKQDYVYCKKLAQNVSFAGIWDFDSRTILYYISKNSLYKIDITTSPVDSLSSKIITNAKKLIHVMRESIYIFIDTNNDLQITFNDCDLNKLLICKPKIGKVYTLAKNTKNAFVENKKDKCVFYFIDDQNNLYKILNSKTYIDECERDYYYYYDYFSHYDSGKLQYQLIFKNVKEFGFFKSRIGDFVYKYILTKNGDLHQSVGMCDFIFIPVQQNVNKIFRNTYSLLLFSVIL